MIWKSSEQCGQCLGDLAVAALIDEVELTPKPGLVDLQSSGSHKDMKVVLMIASARSLYDSFEAMGYAAYGGEPNQELRETLACIGRDGEQNMLHTTGGINTHRGAIWALGLLIAGAAICGNGDAPEQIAEAAGTLARFTDRHALVPTSNGTKAMQTYGVKGARGEAMNGFPHVVKVGLPVLQDSRRSKISEKHARLNALLAIMANLDDTCLIHRGGMETLLVVQQDAQKVLDLGGASSVAGWEALQRLDQDLVMRHVSPGGSADLLAATLFVDRLSNISLHHMGTEGGVYNGKAYTSL
ncbi:triphosphoribosyl-dephospho-CoA synthase [Paenibacillus sp. LMG 31461]|uniref:triphosphoribosyl-dephospho-CoA synthase n=1 Tax=Paenibacillus plantarum TaxID=2654975 RepID=A0ABX1XJE2_9BACL|nr:triphosphoribosyl-dephospho-CoA synthase [Paenibacillus plantarum]NOU68668.1 triphosphoribosyl-dephospho-CoA synthase [Paenibacillus plantarum]